MGKIKQVFNIKNISKSLSQRLNLSQQEILFVSFSLLEILSDYLIRNKNLYIKNFGIIYFYKVSKKWKSNFVPNFSFISTLKKEKHDF